MGKLNIGKSFKSKKFKYGGYATLLTAIVLGVIIALNLVVGQLHLKMDLTPNKMYSLSNKTIGIIKGLKKDVKIIGFYETGKENTLFSEILDKYKTESGRIKIEYVDPVKNPLYAKDYVKEGDTVDVGSLIVVCGNKFQIIKASELLNYTTDEQTGQQTPDSVAAEQKITGAIAYVTSDKNPIIYTLTGHNEAAIPADIKDVMQSQYYTTKDIDLVGGEWKYQPGDILMIFSPARDISLAELQKINDFMSAGGRILFVDDFNAIDKPNFQTLLNNFGVNIQKAFIFEADTQHAVVDPRFLVPFQGTQEIMDPIRTAKLQVVFPLAQPIEEVKIKKRSITIDPLLNTSGKAYAKKDPKSKTLEQETGDLPGPFNVAVAITDKVDSDNPNKLAKMVVFSSSYFLNSDFFTQIGGNINSLGNIDLFTNSLSWLMEKKDNISIGPKSLATESLKITTFQALSIAGFVVIVIPLIVIISGTTVWLRRRHL